MGKTKSKKKVSDNQVDTAQKQFNNADEDEEDDAKDD
jgi:hypothetical protein